MEWRGYSEELDVHGMADRFHGSLFGRSKKNVKASTFVTSRHPITIGDSKRDFSLFLVYPQNGLYSLHTFEGKICLWVP